MVQLGSPELLALFSDRLVESVFPRRNQPELGSYGEIGHRVVNDFEYLAAGLKLTLHKVLQARFLLDLHWLYLH